MAVASDARAGLQHSLRRGWLRIFLMVSVPLALVAVAGYWYLTSGRYAGTDDAYVQADMVQVSADVAGRVVKVEVADNQPVTAGQVLFRLDDSNYRIALAHAEAMLAAARLQIEGLRATYRQKLAEQKEAQDTLAYQQREFERQERLFADHVTSHRPVSTRRATPSTWRASKAPRPSSRSPTRWPRWAAMPTSAPRIIRWCSRRRRRSIRRSSISPTP